MRLVWKVCLAVVVAAAPGFCQEPPSDDNLSFREIQEMLDRFSDTTMRSIEEQLRNKLDAYEESLEKSRRTEAVTANIRENYRLTFTVSGAAPMSILATPGEYSLNGTQDDRETNQANKFNHMNQLHCTGSISPGQDPGSVHVTFEGTGSMSQQEVADQVQRERNATITFSGSANLTLGVEHEIARNSDLKVMLQVEEILETTPAERPTAR